MGRSTRAGIISGVILVLAATAVSAASPLQLSGSAGRGRDGDYKTLGNSTVAQASWTNKASATGRFSMKLEKSAPTTDYVWAAAIVKGVEGLTIGDLGDMGFSATVCGAGSPRFNLYFDSDSDGSPDGVAFYGCLANLAGVDGDWSTMLADASSPDLCYDFDGPCSLSDAATVVQLSVLVDEESTVFVDDVVAAGESVGEPNGK